MRRAAASLLLLAAPALAGPTMPPGDWHKVGSGPNQVDFYIDQGSIRAEGGARRFTELGLARKHGFAVLRHRRLDCVRMTVATSDLATDGGRFRPVAPQELPVVAGGLDLRVAQALCRTGRLP